MTIEIKQTNKQMQLILDVGSFKVFSQVLASSVT